MITSPSGVKPASYAVGTVAPAMMEDSSALTRLKRSPKSSAIPIASQYYLGRDDSARLFFLARDLLAIAAYKIVRISNMALNTRKPSAISRGSLVIATISGIGLSITTLLLNGLNSCVRPSQIASRYFALRGCTEPNLVLIPLRTEVLSPSKNSLVNLVTDALIVETSSVPVSSTLH